MRMVSLCLCIFMQCLALCFCWLCYVGIPSVWRACRVGKGMDEGHKIRGTAQPVRDYRV